MLDYESLKKQFKSIKLDYDSKQLRLTELNEHLPEADRMLEGARNASAIIQDIAQATMQRLEVHLSDLGELALKSVSPDFPSFSAKIEIKRSQTELNFSFVEGGKEQKPLDSGGFGACDVADYAMQVAFFEMKPSRRTLLLDEPFRNVSPDLQHKVSEMVTMITKELEIQQIIISHATAINTAADKTFVVDKKGQISYVTVEE